MYYNQKFSGIGTIVAQTYIYAAVMESYLYMGHLNSGQAVTSAEVHACNLACAQPHYY